MNEDGTMEGMWVEKYNDQYTTSNLDPEVLSVDIHISQEDYLNDLIYSFGHYDADSTTSVVPKSITIKARLRTYDEYAGVEVSDVVTVIVHSSGDTLSDACGFENVLGLDETSLFNYDQHYDVVADADAARVKKLVTNQFTGIENISDDCMMQLYTTLDYMTVEGRWETISFEQWID
jgi:carboxypeptidase C (cathepsin A)